MAQSARPSAIDVYSLDHDGMADQFAIGFLNPQYASKKWLAEFNESCYLVECFWNTIAEGKSVLLLNGSNRQDLFIDTVNRNNILQSQGIDNCSCFYFLEILEQHLKMTIDANKISLCKFVLPDVQDHAKSNGMTFDRALSSSATKKIFTPAEKVSLSNTLSSYESDQSIPRYQFDDTKISLLYAQMHYLASQYPDVSITLKFFDDRARKSSGPDICENLFYVFNKYPQLIPKNIIFEINHYLPEYNNLSIKPEKTWKVQGVGEVDKKFGEHSSLLYHHLTTDDELNKNYYATVQQKIEIAMDNFSKSLNTRPELAAAAAASLSPNQIHANNPQPPSKAQTEGSHSSQRRKLTITLPGSGSFFEPVEPDPKTPSQETPSPKDQSLSGKVAGKKRK